MRARLTTGDPLIAKTGIITAWKRMFVEIDKMFRAPGQYLTADATVGDMTLFVASSLRFNPGDLVLIFDINNQDPEQRVVESTDPMDPTVLNLTSPIERAYAQANRAYVGRVDDTFYEPDVTYLYQAFDQAFTEWVARPDGSGVVPYEDVSGIYFSSNPGINTFSELWFKNGQSRRDLTDYIHLIGARDEFVVMTNAHTVAELNYTAGRRRWPVRNR